MNDAHNSPVAADDLIGVAEIAEIASVSAAAVANWRARSRTFPEPVAVLRAGPVFNRRQVRRWLAQQRKVAMPNVVSMINLKGGVGKTTTTCAFAEMLAVQYRKRVLVVDLDPQTNLTTILIGDQEWNERNSKGRTLAQLFADALDEDRSKHLFDIDQAIVHNASPIYEVRASGNLDLLPSSLDLIRVQDRLATMPVGRYYSRSPVEILSTAIKQHIDEYDWVVIDCPPNLGIITLNGLRISQGYVIPTIPDVLSTYGIPQIEGRVEEFAEEINEPIAPLGIVISKYREQAAIHRNTVETLRNGPIDVFDTLIPEAAPIAQSAEHQQTNTLRQKYGYGDRYDRYAALTKEIMDAMAMVGAGVP